MERIALVGRLSIFLLRPIGGRRSYNHEYRFIASGQAREIDVTPAGVRLATPQPGVAAAAARPAAQRPAAGPEP